MTKDNNKEFKLITLIDNFPSSAWVKNLDLRFVKVNKAYAKTFGFKSPNELIGKKIDYFLNKDATKKYTKEDQYIIKTGKIIKEEETLVINKKTHYFEITKGPIKSGENKIIGTFGIARDITEQKEYEQKLIKSEEKFKNLFEEISEGVAITINFKTSLVNKAFADIFGYEKKELLGKGLDFYLIDGEYQKVLERARLRIRGKKFNPCYETIAKKKDGTHINIELIAKKIIYENQPAIQVIVKDITERTKLQDKVLKDKIHFEQVINSIQDSICVIGRDYKIISFNNAFQKKVGLPNNKITNIFCDYIIPRFDNYLLKSHCCIGNKKHCFLTTIFNNHKTISSIEKSLDSKGQYHYNRITAFPSLNSNKEVDKIVLTIRDITKAASAEEEIKKLNEFKTKILNNIPVCIIILDQKGIVKSVNRYFQKIFANRKILNKSIYDLSIVKNNNLIKSFHSLLNNKQSFSANNCYYNLNHQIKYLDLIATPLFNKLNKIEGVIIMIKDNTETILAQKKLEYLNTNLEKKVKLRTNELNSANKELNKVLSLKSKFLSDASHELRTPLTIIRGNLDLIKNEFNLKNKKTLQAELCIIEKEVEAIASILSDLTTLSNADANQIGINFEKVQLYYLLNTITKSLSVVANKKTVKINLNCKQKIEILGDELKLEKLFLNIIHNAIKYNKKNGVININIEKDKKFVKICIQDTGIGIPKKDIPYIFERFYRVDKSRSKKIGGTGLGLSICKWVIDIHKGSIKVESVINKGSNFIITLPLNLK